LRPAGLAACPAERVLAAASHAPAQRLSRAAFRVHPVVRRTAQALRDFTRNHPMTAPELPSGAAADASEEQAPPACVMSFNASDPSGAGGIAADVSTIAAMGAHALPVVTSVLLRDTAEIFEHSALDGDLVVEQARSVLEDVTIAAWKVGFLGSAEVVSAVAEVLSDYPDVPLVAYLPSLAWLDEDAQQEYLDAFRELVLPQTMVLVGSHQTLTDFLLPDWSAERPASARELGVAAAERGARFVLVTSMAVPGRSGGTEAFIDNVLASAQGAVTGEKFERFEAAFVGAGDTLSAALAALLASGADLHEAVGEALTFLDQSLDAGFRPGMGNVIPDRFFWALPADEDEGQGGNAEEPGSAGSPHDPRHVH
jgi:hydroxymethylpyrimidine/phosphomethylpyrimidine kinase